jgi:hypothetical protein
MSRNRKAEFGGIEKAESGECVREARENSAVQGNESDDKRDPNRCQQIFC